jgi:hypothetical protein
MSLKTCDSRRHKNIQLACQVFYEEAQSVWSKAYTATEPGDLNLEVSFTPIASRELRKLIIA